MFHRLSVALFHCKIVLTTFRCLIVLTFRRSIVATFHRERLSRVQPREQIDFCVFSSEIKIVSFFIDFSFLLM